MSFTIKDIVNAFSQELKIEYGNEVDLTKRTQFDNLVRRMWDKLDQKNFEQLSNSRNDPTYEPPTNETEDDEEDDEEESEVEEMDMDKDVENALEEELESWDVFEEDIEGKITKKNLEKLINEKVKTDKKVLKVNLFATSTDLLVKFKSDKNHKKKLNIIDLGDNWRNIHHFIFNDM
jgi:hypothetical protein